MIRCYSSIGFMAHATLRRLTRNDVRQTVRNAWRVARGGRAGWPFSWADMEGDPLLALAGHLEDAASPPDVVPGQRLLSERAPRWGRPQRVHPSPYPCRGALP